MANEMWKAQAPRLIYDNYEGSDLLPIDPPQPGEMLDQFKERIKDCGDTLFRFLCVEAGDDCAGPAEFAQRIETAIRQLITLQSVCEAHIATHQS